MMASPLGLPHVTYPSFDPKLETSVDGQRCWWKWQKYLRKQPWEGIMKEDQRKSASSLTRRRFGTATLVLGSASVFNFSIGGRAKAASGKVTFYSTMPTNYASKMVEAFHQTKIAKDNDIKLEMFFVNGFALYERAVAEYTAGRVSHDLIMLTDPSLFITLKKDGRLMNYVSPELQAYPADQRDPDGLWCNGRMVLTIYGYNTRQVSDGNKLTSWADLVNPKYSDGKIGIVNALEAGSALQNYYNIRNHPDLGKKWWQELAALKPTIVGGPSPLTKMNISGQTALALNNDYNVYEESKKGAPIASVYPTEIVTASIVPMAIAKAAPNPEAAKIVYDWWLSREGQTLLRDINSIHSGRSDVPPLPGLRSFKDLPVKVAPTQELEANRDELQREFKDIFKL